MREFEAIKKMRENRNITQTLFAEKIKMHRSSYNRIESGVQPARVDEIQTILTNLNANYQDLTQLMLSDGEYAKHYTNYLDYVSTSERTITKEIVGAYRYFQQHRYDSSNHYAVYEMIKTKFNDIVPEIDSFSPKEIKELYNRIIDSSFYTLFDLQLIADTLVFFSEEKIDRIISVIEPTTNTHYACNTRDFRNFHAMLLHNAVESYILFLKPRKARKCLEHLKDEMKKYPIARFQIHIPFHENLIGYIETEKAEYLVEMLEIAQAFKTLGLNEYKLLNEQIAYYKSKKYKQERKEFKSNLIE